MAQCAQWNYINRFPFAYSRTQTIMLTLNYASRVGNVDMTKSIFEASKYEFTMLTDENKRKSLLMVACVEGHADVVDYLIQCGGNVDQIGTATVGGRKHDNVTILWGALANGHLNVVKLLVNRGARVNNDYLLQVACEYRHLNIVEFLIQQGADMESTNDAGYTPLMISCTIHHIEISLPIINYLIASGANIHRKTAEGNSALHTCVNSGSLETMKLLISHGARWMDANDAGITPLMAAAILSRVKIIKFIISQPTCDRQDKIDAWELLGCACGDGKKDMTAVTEYWRKALHERQSVPQLYALASAKHGKVGEYQRLLRLYELNPDVTSMRLQSLTDGGKSLGPHYLDLPCKIIDQARRYDNRDNYECIKMWIYAFDMLYPKFSNVLYLQSELFSLINLFSTMIPLCPVKFSDLFTSFRHAIGNLQSAIGPGREAMFRTVFQFLGLLCLLPLNREDQEELEQAVANLIRLNIRSRDGGTLLNMICKRPKVKVSIDGWGYTLCRFPIAKMVQLLLKCGAPINDTDHNQNTSLHYITWRRPVPQDIFAMLIKYGADMNSVNIRGDTPLGNSNKLYT